MYLPRHIWFVLVVIMISSCSTETLDVTSPTGKLGVTVEPMEGKAYDKITFSVNYDGKTILSQTELGLETDVQKFYGNLKLKSVSKTKRIVDDYKMITGKRSHCINEAFERTYSFENQEGNTLDITFEYMTMGSFSDMKLILLQTKNMSLMNIRHIIFRKEPKDGCSNTTPDTKSFFRYQQMENSPTVPKLTLGDIPDS